MKTMPTVIILGRLFNDKQHAALEMKCTVDEIEQFLKSDDIHTGKYLTHEEAVSYLQTLSIIKSRT